MSALPSAAPELVTTLPSHLRRHLHTGRQLARRHAEGRDCAHPTGVPALDRLLAGGLGRGQLVELVGRRSSGRFSIVLATLAATTSRGDVAALVDLGDALDPKNAAASGIALERLLWIRPVHLKPALIAAETVIGAGFSLVVFDLGLPPVSGGRGAQSSWLRLARATQAQSSTLLVAAPYRVSGTAAATVLCAADARSAWSGRGASPRLLLGARSHIALEKQRGRSRGSTHSTIEQLDLTLTDSLPAVAAPSRSPRLDHPEQLHRSLAHVG